MYDGSTASEESLQKFQQYTQISRRMQQSLEQKLVKTEGKFKRKRNHVQARW